MQEHTVPISEKVTLSVEEAAAYSGIGIGKIRKLLKDDACTFCLKIGPGKSIIKRKFFEEFLLMHDEI